MASLLKNISVLVFWFSFIACGGGNGGGNTDSPNIAPVITSSSTVSIAENESNVTTVTATDSDGDSLSYSLSAGVDQQSFLIDSTSGMLTFITPADFELPTDSDTNNIYLVEVSVSDGNASARQSIEITVTDVAEETSGLPSRPNNSSCVLPDAPILSSAITLNRVFTDLSFSDPIALRQSPVNTDRWYVVEQAGRIRTFLSADSNSTLFADLTALVSSSANEMGLLGIAFHPDYANNNYVFLYYSANGGNQNHQSVLSRFTATNEESLNLSSELEIMRIDQPYNNHNGGNILFGPDGLLYIGMGDGGSGGDPDNYAQNNASLLGKMLRINVDSTANGNNYSIPEDNPFISSPTLDEIYATGLRNPWRWSFDKLTGDLYAADVGQVQREEIDIIVSGGNYGWRCYEGNLPFNTSDCQDQSSYIAPIYDYGRSEGFSITGGYVYRGNAIPGLSGTYIYTDFGSGPIWGLSNPTSNNPTNEVLTTTSFFISSFAEDQDGELYALDFSAGFIYRIDPATETPVGTFPELLSETGCIDNNNPLNMESGLIPYTINAPFWSDGIDKSRWLALEDNSQISIEANGDWTFPNNSVLVKNFTLNNKRIETRLLVRHADGNWGGYSYEWNDQETDASLVLNGKTTNKEGQVYIFPSSSECFICHTTIAGNTLGPETRQLNRDFTYPSTGISANQLATFDSIGMFDAPLSAQPNNLERLTDPSDNSASVSDRARAYLYTNCAQCHQQGGTTNVNIDFHIERLDNEMNICEVNPIHAIGGANYIMSPGNASDSSLVLRMNCRDGDINCNLADQMPPLGSVLVDTDGVNIVSNWVNSLSNCP